MAYYDRYRGSRRRKRNRIKIIILVLLLLVVVSIAALFLLQDAIVFTSEGFRLPFGREEKPAEDPADLPDDVPLEIEDPQPTPGLPQPSQPTQPEEPQPAPDPVPEISPEVHALLFPGSSLLTDREAVLQQSDGYDHLALRVKASDGVSLLDDAAHKDGTSPDAAAFSQALEGVELPKIAMLSALRDNVRPRTVYRASALKVSSGSTWLDREYTAWFDPAGKDTLAALTAQLEACKAADFTQVVLENFHYPTAGKLQLINYGEGTIRQQALTRLAADLRQATDLELGLVLTQTAAENLLDDVSGQDVAELAQYFDVLYIPAADFSVDTALVENAVADTDCRVALLVTKPADVPAGYDGQFLLTAE